MIFLFKGIILFPLRQTFSKEINIKGTVGIYSRYLNTYMVGHKSLTDMEGWVG